MRDCSWIPPKFENIAPLDFECSSDRTPRYNCIAWAAGKTDNFWWPLDIGGYYWPDGLPREPLEEETVENFIRAFATEGYRVCDDANTEKGFEKVVIYVSPAGRPLHAARSLEKGVWTSKLGSLEDIEHATLQCIEGREYGRAMTFLKRPLARSELSNALFLPP